MDEVLAEQEVVKPRARPSVYTLVNTHPPIYPPVKQITSE